MLKTLGHSVLVATAVALPILIGGGDATHFPFGGNRALAQDELSDPLSFTVENFTQYDLLEFYVSPTVIPDDWGDDRLGSDSVGAGQTYLITVDDQRDDCLYDVLGVFSNGQRIDEYQVDLCIHEGTYTYYDEDDVSFNVVNQTNVALREFYFTPSSNPNWGEDLLGTEVIPPGESANIPVNSNECEYDFKAVFADEDEIEQMGVDICQGNNNVVFSEGSP
jgi:hypothetical protein